MLRVQAGGASFPPVFFDSIKNRYTDKTDEDGFSRILFLIRANLF